MTNSRLFKAALMMAAAFPFALDHLADAALAQSQDLGSMTVTGGSKPAAHKKVNRTQRAARPTKQSPTMQAAAPAVVPIYSEAAIGSGAPAGTAPALSPSQGSLATPAPVSVISDKVLRDVVREGGDYNESIKYSPGTTTGNPNGIGDGYGGWRGFGDGQFNLTFDGIPVGDTNDFTHHSAAYFPNSFLGSVVVDRSPGQASQVGYATFGGTQALNSLSLSDSRQGSVKSSFGNFNTLTTDVVAQSGWNAARDTRALAAISFANSDGTQTLGNIQTFQGLLKVEKILGEVKLTALATGGTERFNNVYAPTWDQWHQYGKNYGEVSNDPTSETFRGYNNSLKATDTEYVRLETSISGVKVDNKLYTQSYYYPTLQNNGFDQTVEGSLQPGGNQLGSSRLGQVTYNLGSNDVWGYKKVNNYRSFGDILNLSYDITGSGVSGKLNTGIWVEHVNNTRVQQNYDYTKGAYFSSLVVNPGSYTQAQLNAGDYLTNMKNTVDNVQPFVEYVWNPVDKLVITPGYKFESFNRNLDALVNQKTLLPLQYSKTWNGSLPSLSLRYLLTPNLSIYAVGSKGMLAPNLNYFYVTNPAASSVQPETTSNLQSGVVYKSETLTAAFDIYNIDAKNFPQKQGSGANVYVVNGGDARYQGLEGELTWRFAPNVAIYTSAALMKASYTKGPNEGLRLGGAPNYTLAGGLIYDDQTYFASIMHKITGSSYGSTLGQDQTANTNGIDGTLLRVAAYNSTDIAAGMRSDVLKRMGFGERAEFKVGVNNLLNHRSVTDIQGDPTGAFGAADPSISGAGGLQYFFQAPRTVYASVKIDF